MKRQDQLPCTSIQTSDGLSYTAAHVGGGKNLDIEASAYANCDIGVYISPAHQPYVLAHSKVNGAFKIGVYLDGAVRKIDDTSICVNGENGGSCASGSGSSPGTGLFAQNTPNLWVAQSRIDGYAAGLASYPCPNAHNYVTVNRSTITNATTSPWSFQGGVITTKKDTPAPPVSGSCAGTGTFDGRSNVFVADYGSNAVSEILAPGGYTTVNILGNGFSQPSGIAVDASGNVFVADTGNSAVKEILAAGGYTTVNTLGSGFSNPYGVAVDASGNVFVGDSGNNAVKEILAAGGYTTVNTLASGFNFPTSVAVDASGNVFVADTFSAYPVKEILAAGGYTTVNTLGNGGFSQSRGVAVDASDNVFVADSGNNAVKEILAAGGYTTVKYLSTEYNPWGVAVDASDNVFVADFGLGGYGVAVKEFLAAGGYTTIKTLGSGFTEPSAVAIYNPLVMESDSKQAHRKPHPQR